MVWYGMVWYGMVWYGDLNLKTVLPIQQQGCYPDRRCEVKFSKCRKFRDLILKTVALEEFLKLKI